jgi:hypothetical protein
MIYLLQEIFVHFLAYSILIIMLFAGLLFIGAIIVSWSSFLFGFPKDDPFKMDSSRPW